MEVDAKSKSCPICAYEFTNTSQGWVKWLAILLLVIIIITWIFRI